MPITLDDLTVNFSHLDRDTLLDDWLWLIGPSRLPILLPSIGNAFLQDAEDGTVSLLDAGQAELYHIADSYEDFMSLLKDRQFVMDQFAVESVIGFQRSGLVLKPSQIYSFKTPPLLGGSYALENREATDISVHFSVLGQIGEQAKPLPPGTPITGVSLS